MRIAPKQFVKDLERNFNGRMRIRWSNKRNEWQIEEKVARGLLPNQRISEDDDNLIRLRDGFGLVCSIKPGDRMGCRRCGLELKVPVREFAEVKCPFCAHQGRAESQVAGYFELNDTLIQHLRRISADYAWRDDIKDEIKQHEEAMLASEERDLDNIGEAVASEGYNRMNEVLQVGYTSKTDAMRVKE